MTGIVTRPPVPSRAARRAQLRRAAEQVGELAAASFTRFLEQAALEAAEQAREFAEGARERAAQLPREFVDELTAPLFDASLGLVGLAWMAREGLAFARAEQPPRDTSTELLTEARQLSLHAYKLERQSSLYASGARKAANDAWDRVSKEHERRGYR